METSPPSTDPSDVGQGTASGTKSATDTKSKKPYRVMSFPGGGFDTVMQMGVVHALMVTRRKAPHMAAGISAGAINAVALAEVLQAGGGDEASGEEAYLKAVEVARVARFRELLEAFRNAPSTVFKGFFPDPLETNAAFALKPVKLPRNFEQERKEREESVAVRTGLIRLFNHLFKVRVSVRVVTQIVRVLLGWKAAEELNPGKKCWQRGGLLARLWWIIARNVPSLSLPVGRVCWCWLSRGSGSPYEKGVEAATIIFNRWTWYLWLLERCRTLLFGVLPLVILLSLGLVLALLVLAAALAAPLLVFMLCGRTVDWRLSVAAWSVVIAVVVAAWLMWCARNRQGSSNQALNYLLKYYQIFHDLGDSYPLKEAFVRLFDANYYGKLSFDKSVEIAMHETEPQTGGTESRKKLKHYDKPEGRSGGQAAHQWARENRVRVVALAANLQSGQLEAIPQFTPVVKALMCACAVVPFYKAQRTKGISYIDGINVSNDPITPSFDEARKVFEKAKARADKKGTLPEFDHVRIISVPLLPLSQGELAVGDKTYTGLIDVAQRSLQLQRFQDMLLDKRLVDVVNRALGDEQVTISRGGAAGGEDLLIPAKVMLVVPDHPQELNKRMVLAESVEERRRIIDESVADGCRAMIERLVADGLDTGPDSDEWPPVSGAPHNTLRDAVKSLQPSGETPDHAKVVSCKKLLNAWARKDALPDSDEKAKDNAGLGLSEICLRCTAFRRRGEKAGGDPDPLRGQIRLPAQTPEDEKKNHKDAKPALPEGENQEGAQSGKINNPNATLTEKEKKEDAQIVFLFSGGVFRGVFQVGFANAVSELGIKPDVVAGASVGTIIGALIGRVFENKNSLLKRQTQMRRLAATFLTIDRFVITDRFADFIRHFSIHAASADFSPRDIDLLFRRYDRDRATQYERRARRVALGVERLFYLTPFELFDLAKAFRADDFHGVVNQFEQLVQYMMDRYGVGVELLGPEPLEQLINGFVFDADSDKDAELNHFGFPLMGTTTNLTSGRLDILRQSNEERPRFTQSLLASSAFPAVFRPRWSWEVSRDPKKMEQFADGGIMDNVPLDAVVQYLKTKKDAKRRPTVPHLILTATLEVSAKRWGDEVDPTKRSWIDIHARAAQLRYNGKIDKFQKAQRSIRSIIGKRGLNASSDPMLPMNLEVVAVKPAWMCGTFAFHPMLGFSRRKQAASIAHGCASTLCAVADYFDEDNKEHGVDPQKLRDWATTKAIQLDQLPRRPATGKSDAPIPGSLSPDEVKRGVCWFRSGIQVSGGPPICPFHSASPAADDRSSISVDLELIYVACGKKATHMAQCG